MEADGVLNTIFIDMTKQIKFVFFCYIMKKFLFLSFILSVAFTTSNMYQKSDLFKYVKCWIIHHGIWSVVLAADLGYLRTIFLKG